MCTFNKTQLEPISNLKVKSAHTSSNMVWRTSTVHARKVNSLNTSDFSTLLYTTLPHDRLKGRICRLIRKSFSHGNNTYINVACNREFFSFEPYKKPCHLTWTQTEFIRAFIFLINNIYVKFGVNIYCQTLGIPMNTDCAPLLADLYL